MTVLPTNPVALRREYLKAAKEVATHTPTTGNTARLIAMTQALLRDVCGEPGLEIRIGVPREAMRRSQAKEGGAA